MENQIFKTMKQGVEARFAFLKPNISETGVLAGPEKLFDSRWWERSDLWMGWDNCHYPLNYSFLLQQGVPALLQRANRGLCRAQTIENRERLQAIIVFLERFISFIAEHAALAEKQAQTCPADAERLHLIANNCLQLSQGAPETFLQGLQLFYFAWRVRSLNYTSCIGRLDVQLQPLYDKDRADGMTREAALAYLCELIVKLNKMGQGDTLMNVMLGGVDKAGRDSTSELSVQIIEAAEKCAMPEPHINVRIHEQTPAYFWEAVCKLIAQGQGQGTLYLDEAIIPQLVKSGYDLEVARCYANDGCTEVTLEGSSDIQFWQVEAMKTLELALFNGKDNPCAPYSPIRKWNRQEQSKVYKSQLVFGIESGDVQACKTFQQFMVCFYRQWDAQLTRYCERICEQIISDKEQQTRQTSLLVQSLTPRCLDEGVEVIRGGYVCDNYQLLSGSLPTVADCLAGIQKVVFEDERCSMADLLTALACNFQNYEPLRQQLADAPKFGNDDPMVDGIAAELATHFCEFVEKYPFPHQIHVLPGMYNIDFILFASILGATPDGRHAGDPICCHYSPTPSKAINGPTAALQSAAKGNLERGVAASPVYLTLPRLLDVDYPATVSALIKGIQTLHLPIVNLSIASEAELLDAVEHPEAHRDLVVRVWGYNAYFVDLDRPLQQHIIDRIMTQA